MAATETSPAAILFEYDLEMCGGAGEMAGADEVGRGCLAGPIVAAAVTLDYSRLDIETLAATLKGLGDSKKLTAVARKRLYPLILRNISRFSVISYSSRTIDECGLHKTNLRVLARSLESLEPCPKTALVDGRQQLPDCQVEHQAITKGDTKSACIAAASIVAKVIRDRLMLKLHEQYPEYGFSRHMGYGSLDHREAIAAHGYSPQHRRSFNVTLPRISETLFEDGEAQTPRDTTAQGKTILRSDHG